ncbi:PaaI family thioesterase [Actinocorallia lasiicapitis]
MTAPAHEDVDEDTTRLVHQLMPFAKELGLEVTLGTPAEVRGRLDWRPELCTAGRLMHGGALMAAADSIGASCAFLNLPPGAVGTATVSFVSHFFRGVPGGRVDFVARPLHIGGKFITVEVTVVNGGETAAKVTQTQAVRTPARS